MTTRSGITTVIVCLILLVLDISFGIIAHYQYDKQFESYWSLAVKASSIEKKIEGIDKFVTAIESTGYNGKYAALFLETPDNSFDANLEALKSLQARLHQISAMDIKSFEYQTALSTNNTARAKRGWRYA